MRSKAPLALMEQAVMVLVFALASALCLRVFVWSDYLSKQGEARDRAAVAAQTAAEVIKHEGAKGGDTEAALTAAAEELGAHTVYDGDAALFQILYDGGWNASGVSREAAEYTLYAESQDSGVAGLGQARVWVQEIGSEDSLFEITVAWQTEVGA